MAARVTEEEVREILTTSLTSLTAFISTANVMVTEELVGEGLSDDRLKEIERYLAAHFACIASPRKRDEKVDVASATYRGKTDMGLDATLYGQQAKILDTTGILAATSSGAKNATLEML